MKYVVHDGRGRARVVEADFYNYWPGKPYVTFWASVRGRDVVVTTIKLGADAAVRPKYA